MLRLFAFVSLVLVLSTLAVAQVRLEPAGPAIAPATQPHIYTWGDQGDGTYANPIIKSDYSDPDICRVGSDFYLVASDFHYMGMQIMHSRDLVNWQVIGQLFHKLDIDPKYEQMNGYGQGTWAPSIRYHDGTFFVYVCTPYDGLLLFKSKAPTGPWQQTVVKAIPKWEDPCPLWDDDGQAYLVHSLKGAGPLIVHKLSSDGTQLLDDGKEVYRAGGAEGPKFYKRHGYYYISLPEGGVATGGQTILRSKDIYGPYERRQVMVNGSTHQGGFVELDNGQCWFISFKQTGFLGRIDYLNPVVWGEDDWPTFGDAGKIVARFKKPDVGQTYPIEKPATNDEFEGPELSPVWQWNHNPVDADWSLTERPGFLTLRAQVAADLAHAHNTLTQKLFDDFGAIDVKIDVTRLTEGDTAGLTFMGGTARPATQPAGTTAPAVTPSVFDFVGVRVTTEQTLIVFGSSNIAIPDGSAVYFRAVYRNDRGSLLYSIDGATFTDTGLHPVLRFGNWKGARVGIFCYGRPGGVADFDYFHYHYGSSATEAGIEP